MFSDGEYFSGKGVGRVAISPKEGVKVDVFVTHTISEDGNYEIREKQVDELIGLVEGLQCLPHDGAGQDLQQSEEGDDGHLPGDHGQHQSLAE